MRRWKIRTMMINGTVRIIPAAVAQPVLEQGATAARLLLDVLDRGVTDVVDVVVPTPLVVRGSTAAPLQN